MKAMRLRRIASLSFTMPHVSNLKVRSHRESFMQKLSSVFLMLLLVSSPSVFGAEISKEKRADIEKLLEMTGALAVGQQMSTAVAEQMSQLLRKARPDIPDRVLSVLPEEISSVIDENASGFKDVLIPLYDRHFSDADIKELIAFYSTTLGQKTIRVMPVLMNESLQAGQQWGQSLSPAIQARVKARLEKEGYKL